MSKAPSSYGTRDAAIFSRGSLTFTYELLRETNAELAEIIQNIIESPPLPQSDAPLPDNEENNQEQASEELAPPIADQATEQEPVTAADGKKAEEDNTGERASDHFRIELRPMQVRAILEALLLHEQENQETQNICQEIMGQALIEDWMNLAYQIIAELPKEQQSSTLH